MCLLMGGPWGPHSGQAFRPSLTGSFLVEPQLSLKSFLTSPCLESSTHASPSGAEAGQQPSQIHPMH